MDPAAHVTNKLKDEGFEIYNECFGADFGRKFQASYDAIYGANCFAHIDDMVDVVTGVDLVLKPNGVFIMEVQYLPLLLKDTLFDYMYHEHMSYYTLLSLGNFVSKFGMKLFDAKRLEVHGGSIRVFVDRVGSDRGESATLVEMKRAEVEDIGMNSLVPYSKFSKNCEQVKNELLATLDKLKSENQRIFAYGAAARATSFCLFCGVGKQYIEAFVDDSTLKQGTFVPGLHIRICHPNVIARQRPDVIFVTAWTFLGEIAKRQREYLENGGKFLVAFPEVRVLDASDFKELLEGGC